MKRHLTTLALLAAGAGALFASTQEARTLAQENGDLEGRVADLESKLAACEERLTAAAEEIAALRAEGDAVERYLHAQAKAAASMSAVLDDAEAKGFTYGINPDSRHALMAGWRAAIAAAQRDLPGAPAKPAAPAEAGAGAGAPR